MSYLKPGETAASISREFFAIRKPEPSTEERPRCAVRGLIRPGFMCGAVIVGGEFCGSSKECQHKLPPNTEAQGRR